jgi:hypothetical protein
VCVLQITSLLKNHESLWTRNLAKNNESLWNRSEYDVRPLLTIIRFFSRSLEVRESWPFCHIEKKGDFFRLIWAEIFLHKSLTDSGISHRFLRLFSFYTIARRFEYLHICGIFLHRCRRRISSNIAARPWRPPWPR